MKDSVMQRGVIISIFLLVSGLFFSQASYAMKMDHSKHQKSSLPEVCQNKNTIPTLQCASTTSSHFDNNGNLWVAWYNSGHVYLSQSGDKGKTFQPPVIVNRSPELVYAKGENRPKLAFGNNGEIYVSWTMKLTEKRFSGHIRFSRSVDGGKTFSDPLTVNDHLEVTSHRFDSMAVNKNGDIYIAWLDKRDLLAAKKAGKKYNGSAVYYALSTNNGKSFLENKKIADTSCECCRTAIAIDTDQLPVIVWRHIFGDNIRDHGIVKFSQRNQPGKIKRLSFDKWHIEGCPHHGPSISIADDGVYHTTWFNNAPQRHGLFYAKSTDKMAAFSTPMNFGDYEKTAAHPDVLSLGNKVFIVWKEFDGKQSALYIKQSLDAGHSWTKPKQLATTTAITDHPFVISDNKNVYASWQKMGEKFQLIKIDN
ncbi:MAG: glycoside hydrolase [Gammaproteobacteria bacterium]|nr:glycoside hydrolase [Gammaproteobacteria bacterium]